MDSKKILPIFFFFFFTLLTLSRQSRVLPRDSRSPLSSPSPSPSPSPLPFPSPASELSDAGCWHLSESCRNGSLAACIDPSSSTSKGSLLLVRNVGEKPLEVKVTVSHAKLLIENIQIAAHEKVNVSVNLGGNSSILLDAGELECVIRIRSTASIGGIVDYIPFATHITAINGAYLLLLTGLIFGCTWACYKRGNRGQQGDGIPYQDLEMGQQPDSPSANNVRTDGGWEQDWDGDWDELKSDTAMGHQMAHRSGNILTSRPPKRDGGKGTWDD